MAELLTRENDTPEEAGKDTIYMQIDALNLQADTGTEVLNAFNQDEEDQSEPLSPDLKSFWLRTKSKTLLTEEELVHLGKQLRQSKAGGYITIGSTTSSGAVFYLSMPPEAKLCAVNEGVIILETPKLLRNLCEAVSSSSGLKTQWNCKTKDIGRMNARCTFSGQAARSQGTGIRNTISRKVGCSAYVTTVSLNRLVKEFPDENINEKLSATATDIMGSAQKHLKFCVINTVCLTHSGHTPDELCTKKLFLPRSTDVIADPKLKSSLETFYRVCPPGYGSAMRASRYLNILYPHIEIPYETVRNVVARLQDDEYDAQKLVPFLQAQKEKGEVEYVDMLLDEPTGILKSIIWSYKGSFEVVQRCGELLFWDSTHDLTQYAYKLSTFTVVDSEGRCRAVLLAFNLNETAEDFKRMLTSWHNAFQTTLPAVIFTDGDEAIYAAIASVPYPERILHLLCTIHIFDLNVKKKLGPVISFYGGAATWPLFRKALSTCREAVNEEDLERLWSDMLQEWFPNSARHKEARLYLQKEIWRKRRQWATVYFRNSFTLGAMSTQRSESWNNLLKCFAVQRSLVSVVQAIEHLVNSQCKVEKRARNVKWRTEPLQACVVSTVFDIMRTVKVNGLSRYACVELKNEINAAGRMAIEQTYDDVESNEAICTRKGNARYAYGEDPEQSSLTAVSVQFNLIKDEEKIMSQCSVDCSCLYPQRMGLPCRHSMALCMHLDRSQNDSLIKMLQPQGFMSTLEFLWSNARSERWKLHETHCSIDADDECAPFAHVPQRLIQTKAPQSNLEEQKGEEQDMNVGLASSGMRTGEYKADDTFPDSISKDGSRLAYSIMMGSFRSLADILSKKSSFLRTGFVLHNFAKSIIQELNGISNDDTSLRSIANNISVIERQIQSAFEFAEQHFQEGDDLLPVNPEVPCLDTKAKQDHNKKDKGTSLSGSIVVRNPPKRKDTRKANPSTLRGHKIRQARRKRSEAAKRAPAGARTGSGKTLSVPKRPTVVGYACPLCADIKVQNNPQNVIQHFRSKHGSEFSTVPSLAEMMDAVQNRNSEGQLEDHQSEKRRKSTNEKAEERVHKKRKKSPKVSDEASQNINEDKPAEVPERETINSGCMVETYMHDDLSRNVWEEASVSDLKEGCTVQTFWKQNLAWYQGKVMSLNKSDDRSSAAVEILYDDGELEELPNIMLHRWRIIRRCNAYPTTSWALNEELAALFHKNMEEAMQGKGIYIGHGTRKVRDHDFLTS